MVWWVPMSVTINSSTSQTEKSHLVEKAATFFSSFPSSIFFLSFVSFRALRTMIDLGRITSKCTDCPQVIPIAGDLASLTISMTQCENIRKFALTHF